MNRNGKGFLFWTMLVRCIKGWERTEDVNICREKIGSPLTVSCLLLDGMSKWKEEKYYYFHLLDIPRAPRWVSRMN